MPKDVQLPLVFESSSWTLEHTDSLVSLFIRAGMKADYVGHLFDKSPAEVRAYADAVLQGKVSFTDFTVYGYGFEVLPWNPRADCVLRRMVGFKRTPTDCSKILLRLPQSIRNHWKEIK